MAGFPFAPQTPAFPLGEDDKRMALIQGLLAGGGALMQAGGPSTTPVSAGQAFGSGIGSAMGAFQNAQRTAAAQKQAQAQQQQLQAQTAVLTAQAEAQRRKQEAIARLTGGATMPLGAAPGAQAPSGPQFPLGPGMGASLADLAAIDEDYLSKMAVEGMKPPQTREVQKGREKVTEQFNRQTNQWEEIGRGSLDAPDKGPEDVRKYEYAKGQGFKGSLEDWVRMEKGASGAQEQFGMAPIWGTDAQGNAVLMQPSNRGGIKQVQLPPGITAQRGQTSRVDLGTQWGILDAAGTIIGYLPKDVKGEAAQRATGTAQGEAQAAAPEAIAKVDNVLKTIDDVLNDPALPASVGVYSYLQDVPATKQKAFGLKAAQLKGQAFLQAFESLKGGGAITKEEGDKATQAIARLDTTQRESDFRAALNDLRSVVMSARSRMEQRARGEAPVIGDAPQPTPPSLNSKNPSGFSIRRID